MPRWLVRSAVLVVVLMACTSEDRSSGATSSPLPPVTTSGPTTSLPHDGLLGSLVCGDPDPPARTEFEWLADSALRGDDPGDLAREAVEVLLDDGFLNDDPGPLEAVATDGDLTWWGAERFRVLLRQEADGYVTVRTESCVGA